MAILSKAAVGGRVGTKGCKEAWRVGIAQCEYTSEQRRFGLTHKGQVKPS